MPQKFISKNTKLNSVKSLDLSWLPYLAVGAILSLGSAIALNYTNNLPQLLVFGGIIGIFIAFIVFQNPEIGAYFLIFTVFTNMSDLLTEKGCPSVNKPLIAITILSIFAHFFFKTEKHLKLPKITRLEAALLTYFAIVATSSLVAVDQNLAINGFIDLMKDVAVGFCILITLNTKPKLKSGIATLILAVAFVSLLGVTKTLIGTEQTFWGLAQNSAFGQVNESGVLRYGGPIGESNVWAQVLAATLPFVIYQFAKRREPFIKFIMLAFAALIFLSMLFTQSRGAILATLLVLPLIALEMRIKFPTLVTLAVIGIVVLLVVPSQYTERIKSLQIFFKPDPEYGLTQDESVAGRREKMLTGLAMFQDNPFLGVGFYNYNTRYWEYAGKLGLESSATDIQSEKGEREAHSLYVEIISETGILGFLSFLTFFGLLFWDLYQSRKIALGSPDKEWPIWVTAATLAIISFLTSGLFLHGIRFRYIWVLIGLALAIIYITKQDTSTTIHEESFS